MTMRIPDHLNKTATSNVVSDKYKRFLYPKSNFMNEMGLTLNTLHYDSENITISFSQEESR